MRRRQGGPVEPRVASVREAPDDFDSDEFARGCSAAQAGAHLPTTLRRAAFLAAHPRGAYRYVSLLRRLPTVTVALPLTADGVALREQFARQSWWHLGSYGVLELPDSLEDYLRGRSRQALRTNLRRAQRAGLRCQAVPASQQAAVVAAFEQSQARECEGAAGVPVVRFPAEIGSPLTRWFSVTDAHGEVLGVAYAAVAGRTAVLRLLMSTGAPDTSHLVRYALHGELVRTAIAAKVRWLVVEGLLAAPSGLRYFAARLGFRACRLAWCDDGIRSPLTVVPTEVDLRHPAPSHVEARRLDGSRLA